MRATPQSVILPGLAKLGPHAGGHGAGECVLPVACGVQVYQRGPAGGMTHAFHKLAGVGPGLGDQLIAGVAQVMKVNVQARGNQGREPDTTSKRSASDDQVDGGEADADRAACPEGGDLDGGHGMPEDVAGAEVKDVGGLPVGSDRDL